jgi:hypothetical protein
LQEGEGLVKARGKGRRGEERTVATGEERFAVQHLGENAADGPDVDREGVLLETVGRGEGELFPERRRDGKRTHVSMISGARYHLVATYL